MSGFTCPLCSTQYREQEVKCGCQTQGHPRQILHEERKKLLAWPEHMRDESWHEAVGAYFEIERELLCHE